MKIKIFFCALLNATHLIAAPVFVAEKPIPATHYLINTVALCKTAKETLAYLKKGTLYDPRVIHEGKVFKISLERVKASLKFVCQHQKQLNDPDFIKKHFDFVRWYPDMNQIQRLNSKKPLIANFQPDKILMTKYYVHLAKASTKPTQAFPLPLYGLPRDEVYLTHEQANEKPDLIRFQYGKQAILKGVLANKNVPVLAYLNRDDLEAALLQGTIVADFGTPNHRIKTFNVHRCNNIPYNKTQAPYNQERYWYFKAVEGIKGYGKDAEHKITVNPEVTFAADLEQFGLGKMLMIQYPDKKGAVVTQVGLFADTGGAFQNNQYQVDYLAGSYAGKEAFYKASHNFPDYVAAYFMVLKK
jgi:membrane-bound lytic murein transglycosylase